MKKYILITTFTLLTIFAASDQADAAAVYGLSLTGPDYTNNLFYGLSIVEEDYDMYLYYDTYVEGYLYEGTTPVDAQAFYGTNISAVLTGAPGHGGSIYTLLSRHFVVAYYFVSGFGWLDYWGLSIYGGDYGFVNTWEGGSSVYYIVQAILLGVTAAQEIFSAEPTKVVTISSFQPMGTVQIPPNTPIRFVAELTASGGSVTGAPKMTVDFVSNPSSITFNPKIPMDVSEELSDNRATIAFDVKATNAQQGQTVSLSFGLTSVPTGAVVGSLPIPVTICYGTVTGGVCR